MSPPQLYKYIHSHDGHTTMRADQSEAVKNRSKKKKTFYLAEVQGESTGWTLTEAGHRQQSVPTSS